jgi:hypothetical protein
MKAMSKQGAKVLDKLADGLGEFCARTVDNTNGIFMPVHVENLGPCPMGTMVSIAHYYEQNGDLVPDPEGVFIRAVDGTWWPMHLQQCMGNFTEAIRFEESVAEPFKTLVNHKAGNELASFGNMWMKNIWAQQYAR